MIVVGQVDIGRVYTYTVSTLTSKPSQRRTMAITRSTETRLIEVVELDTLFEVRFTVESRSMRPNWGGLPDPPELNIEVDAAREVDTLRDPTDREWAHLEPLIEQEIDEMLEV